MRKAARVKPAAASNLSIPCWSAALAASGPRHARMTGPVSTGSPDAARGPGRADRAAGTALREHIGCSREGQERAVPWLEPAAGLGRAGNLNPLTCGLIL